MHTLQTHVCYVRAPKAAVGYLATKGQLVGIYDPGWPQRGDETNMFRFGTKACVLFSGCSAWRSKHTSCHPLNGYLVHYY